jgi:hypothetical protein
MYQVTAIFMGSEISYGEGESIDYAMEECIGSIPEIFSIGAEPEEIELSIIHPNGRKSSLSLQDQLGYQEVCRMVGL